MGRQYGLQCASCDYGITVQEGIGMMYSPRSVFYGYGSGQANMVELLSAMEIAETAYGIPNWIRDKALSYLNAPLRDAYTRWQKFLSHE